MLTPCTPPQVNEQLVGERSGLAEVLRREFADRLAASEEDTRVARAELAELRARQRLELEQLSREKQAELEEVHQRWARPWGRTRGWVGGAGSEKRMRAAGPPLLAAGVELGVQAAGGSV